MSPIIRAYGAYDFDDIYDIYSRTADGENGRARHSAGAVEPDLVVGPYLTFEPELAFVVDDDDDGVAGYIIATADTRRFVERVRTEWMPRLAAQAGSAGVTATAPDRHLRSGVDPEWTLLGALDVYYPAHFQLNVLPGMRGRGIGRMLIDSLRMALRARGVAGVHVTVDPANSRLGDFYHSLGFMPLPSAPSALGIRTTD